MSNKTPVDKEIEKLMGFYPNQALQGRKLQLSATWKKGFTAFMALEMVNAKFMKQLGILGEQISDDFNSKFDKGIAMELNEDTVKNLRLVFRLKNGFSASAGLLLNTLNKIDPLIVPERELMEKDLYAYYISSKGVLKKTAEEQRKLVLEIDRSGLSSFAGKTDELQTIEKESLEGIHTEDDMKVILARIGQSLGVELV